MHPCSRKRLVHSLLLAVLLTSLLVLSAHPAAAADDLKGRIQSFMDDAKSVAQIIAPVIAFIGLVALGVVYTGAGIPGVNQWKQQNPNLASSAMLGIGVLIAASSIISLISFG